MNRQSKNCSYGRITQLGECHLDKVEVAGSSPVLPTISDLNRKRFRFFLFLSGFIMALKPSFSICREKDEGICFDNEDIMAYIVIRKDQRRMS